MTLELLISIRYQISDQDYFSAEEDQHTQKGGGILKVDRCEILGAFIGIVSTALNAQHFCL